jgi:high-affinity iron transporter
VIALLAAAVLFSMSFWMISKVESRRWTGYLRKGLEESLTRRNLASSSASSFLAVYREAAETVLFTQALLLEAPGRPGEVWGGRRGGAVRGAGPGRVHEPNGRAPAPRSRSSRCPAR